MKMKDIKKFSENVFILKGKSENCYIYPRETLQNIGMRKSYIFIQNEKILPIIARGFFFSYQELSTSSGRQICYFAQQTHKEG